MKFTSYDLMKAIGLQVGDKVKHLGEIYTVRENDDLIHSIYLYIYKDGKHIHLDLFEIFDKDFEILPRPKRVGDLICDCQSCANCPLRMIDCFDEFGNDFADMTLYEILDFKNEDNKDQEIYDLLKARLDKEVEE